MVFVNKQGGNAKIVKIEEFNDEQGIYSGEENLFVMTRMEDTLDNTATPLNASNLNKANFKDSDCIEFKTTTKEISEDLRATSTFKIFCTTAGDVWFVSPSGNGLNINLTKTINQLLDIVNIRSSDGTIEGIKVKKIVAEEINIVNDISNV
jgi:hypothetical protein